MGRRSQRHKQEVQGLTLPITAAAWVAGTDTVTPVVVTAGNARCERLGANNPRISKQVTGLLVGATYRIDSVYTVGTAALTGYCRVSATANLTAPDYIEMQVTVTGPYSMTFVAPPGGMVYVGVVLGSTANGNYCLTKDTFTITRTA